ncbi:hypothetical protein SH449x_003459 [Pirellulaceae bacterium SH449]
MSSFKVSPMNTGHKQLWYAITSIAFLVVLLVAVGEHAKAALPNQTNDATVSQCVIIEVFVDQSRLLDQQLESRIREFARERGGILIAIRKLQDGSAGKARLEQIANHFKIERNDQPLLYCLNQVIHSKQSDAEYQKALEEALQIEVFVRVGCSRCDTLKQFLPNYAARFPALKLVLRDIVQDPSAMQKLNQLVTKYKRAASSVPVIHFCNELSIGFLSEQSCKNQLDELLRKWTKACPAPKNSNQTPEPQQDKGSNDPSDKGYPEQAPADCLSGASRNLHGNLTYGLGILLAPVVDTRWLLASEVSFANASRLQTPALDDELELDDDELMLPIENSETANTEESELGSDSESNERSTIDVPWLGRLSANKLGMPLFTIAVGLVDGFNPCAMWVLMFLLSILVNLKDRVRIILIAGIFVLVSGLAYYAFMAAWLNVFLFVGLLRPIQIGLGILALVVGGIHIKDFFAFKKGVSLSIPESAKPGIYQRARSIVTAENLFGALVGVTVLAILVNIVELLCTAGLPALYTGVLTMQNLPSWQNYAYLALYIMAYMFDDTLMVVIVVWTMKKTKMQESHGQWLKLVSGVVIVAIGMVMLLKPSWLY